MKQAEFELKIIPQKWQICSMCHISSGCEKSDPYKCCNKCIDKCNSRQNCGHDKKYGDQSGRLSAWLYQVNTNEAMKKYRKLFKRR